MLAALLAFGVVGFQHVVHVTLFGTADPLSDQLVHWLRDGALAMPLGLLAVWTGRAVARPAGSDRCSQTTRLGEAAVVSFAFSAALVPSVLFHGALEPAAGHIGQGMELASGEHPGTLAGALLHGLRDALLGQVAALPLAALGLVLVTRSGVGSRPPRTARTAEARRRRALSLATVTSLTAGLLVVSPGPFPSARAATADPCSSGAPERAYDVSAINVRITLNRFGDNDPGGYMYALDAALPAVRAQEASNQVSTGLRTDAIQPLVLRANLGECLVVRFTNRLTTGPVGAEGGGGPAPRTSFHVSGLAFQAGSQGGAVGRNADTSVAPGASRTFRIAMTGQEGAHVVSPLGDMRAVTDHGLFGSVIAEPAGSRYLAAATGAPDDGTNWEAIIEPPSGPSFREFVLNYHEVGNEDFNVRDRNGLELPLLDSLGVYRPASRAINYRSEQHSRRTELGSDESQAYGSYAFGDPATPTPRSYLGEPTKTRILNAGAEMGHVHHLHGGGTRWKRSPGAGDTDFASGLRKSVDPGASIRLDSQIVEPGESSSLEHECGAGGCQQAAGDYLFHCHIGHHYLAGMWAFWRVFDTRQPDLATIPSRPAAPTAVTSDELIGKVIEGKTIVAAANLTDPASQRSVENLVESQLPRQGVTLDAADATVWDYQKLGTAQAPLYVGEPEDTRTWANFASPAPGQRPPILFNPTNGRYAWPLLRPHLAKRPPFSPNGHGGAPWLGDDATPTRPDGLCPANSVKKRYDISAITLPVRQTDSGLTDDEGQLFVLNEDREDVLAGRKRAEPLAIRSNGGEAGNAASVGDCVSITLSSQLRDNEENFFKSKVNIHTHFVQFDPQASDGVISGPSFEQSVRPYSTENRTLTAPAAVGATTVAVTNLNRLRVGIDVAVGQGDKDIEIRRIVAMSASGGGGTLTLDRPLEAAHQVGEATGVEFVQYRWFSDVDLGTVFWHDHVQGVKSWDHGLFGAHIIEPPGSTYHDPRTGAEVRSGAIVDIRTAGRLGAGVQGSFREFMVWMHNDARARGNDGDGRGSINLLAEPLNAFNPVIPNPNDRRTTDPYAFSSVRYGDPFTPLPRAYVGDNFVFRVLGVAEKEAALRVVGHRFREERFNAGGRLTDAATVGISERGDYVLDGGAGGAGGKAGDYLYYSTVQRELEDGAWGILRVHDTSQVDLQPLPSRPPPPTGAGFPVLTTTGASPPVALGPGQPCPGGAPLRRYDVSILNATLPTPVPDPAGRIYALSSDVAAIRAGTKPVEPLALRAATGECVEIVLANLTSVRASLALGGVVADPQGSGGSAVGFNPDSTVAPGGTRTYRYFADKELGTLPFLNLADISSVQHGGYGALVIEPAGATWSHPATGATINSGLVADVQSPAGNFRELVALFSDADSSIGRSSMPYPRAVEKPVSLNYRAAPFKARGAGDPTSGSNTPGPAVFSSAVFGDPATTRLEAYAGDPVRIRAAYPAAEQFHSLWTDGHVFPLDPGIAGSSQSSARTIAPGQSIDAHLVGGAGGVTAAPGDYVYGDRRLPYTEAGLWGLLRVHATAQANLRPLGAAPPPPPPPPPPAAAVATVTPAGVAFVDQRLGTTSTPSAVTISNTGAAGSTLNVSAVAVSGPDFKAASNSCLPLPRPLAAGASCAVGVTFTPSALGTRTGNVAFSHDATGGASNAPLSGTGVGPPPVPTGLTASVPSSSQITVSWNASIGAARYLVFRNGALTPTATAATTTFADAGLAPDTAFTYQVVAEDAAGGQSARSALLSARTLPVLSATPSSVDFGSKGVVLGSVSRTVTVTNNALTNQSVSSLPISGANPGDFRVANNLCTGVSLAPKGTCTFALVFDPTVVGLRTATGTVNWAGGGTGLPVPLQGRGTLV